MTKIPSFATPVDPVHAVDDGRAWAYVHTRVQV
jgi:hypothetical protein